jgi:hypothetical protein
MAENETFSRLVSDMPLEERTHLLERLSTQSNISKDPLYAREEDEPMLDIEGEFARLPWYRHIWFFFLSLFKTISQIKLYEESQVRKTGKKIQLVAPGVYDYKRNLLLPIFYESMTDMRDGARFFYSALDTSINRDKGAFYAFLGSLEMQEVHQRLQNQTNPHIIIAKFPEAKEADIRKIAFHEMGEALAEITPEQRIVMYDHARSLECLKELATFRFDRLLLSFSFDPVLQGHLSPAHVMREPLENLNNILFSFKEPPSIALIESLFVFILHEKIEEDGSGMEVELRELLIKAENALVAIRTFNKHIPLTLILRCAGRNMTINPQAISGGEDWFVIYHEYWKERIEQQLSDFRTQRRQQELIESLNSFFNGKDLKNLENAYAEETNPDGMPIRGTFSLAFLQTFYTIVFINDINNGLRNILIDGKFTRRENRTIFTENYNNLIKLEDDIKLLDLHLSPSGEYGKRYGFALSETSLQSRRRKMQVVLDDAGDEAEEIITRTKTSIEGLIAILTSIVTKDGNGQYTTLINMAHFMAKNENADLSILTTKGQMFLKTMNDIIQKFKKTLQIMEDIIILELDDQ